MIELWTLSILLRLLVVLHERWGQNVHKTVDMKHITKYVCVFNKLCQGITGEWINIVNVHLFSCHQSFLETTY